MRNGEARVRIFCPSSPAVATPVHTVLPGARLGLSPEQMLDLGGIDVEEIATALADQTLAGGDKWPTCQTTARSGALCHRPAQQGSRTLAGRSAHVQMGAAVGLPSRDEVVKPEGGWV